MRQIEGMRKGILFVVFLGCSKWLMAQSEVGPEGDKLLWVVLALLLVVAVIVFAGRFFTKKKTKPLFVRQKAAVALEKNALYYPDNLTLRVKNTGNTDIDLDTPLLVFDNFWLKRKFKLKGFSGRHLYPLYLEKGKSHVLDIELNRFYLHDKRLKRFPKVKIEIRNINGKRLGRCSVFLRKTLVKW